MTNQSNTSRGLTEAEAFARWLEDGPRLAKAAGCYVSIKVTSAPPAALQEQKK